MVLTLYGKLPMRLENTGMDIQANTLKILVVLIVHLLMIQACGSTRGSNIDTEHQSRLLTNQSLETAEGTRNYHLYLPDRPANAQIVLLLHGHSGSGDHILGLDGVVSPFKLWLDVALEENLILVAPDGVRGASGQQGWNDCRRVANITPESDDVQFVDHLIKHVKNRHASSNAKTFVVGISNGGMMSQRLADEAPEIIDAMAIIVASRPADSECRQSNTPVPVLFINGTSDPLTPYNGGQILSDRGEVISTPDTVSYWVNRNQAETNPLEIPGADINRLDNSTITRYAYRNSTGKTVVQWYEIVNGGHTEPSIAQRYGRIYKLIVGNQNRDIEMAHEVWDFLKQFEN